MLTDPYLIFVKCFSTWLRIRFIMVFTICWCIVLLGVAGWTVQNIAGSITSKTFTSGNSYKNWNNVCKSSPYIYLKPFSFTYSGGGGS
jgi:hypothetical protein